MFETTIGKEKPPFLPPWKTVDMDPAFSGQWIVTGDLDNDGDLEIVSVRNEEQAVATAIAYKLDGSELWHWGKKNAGKFYQHHDIPLQLYDINGDGHLEVILSIKGELLVLEGATGKEIQRFPLPRDLPVADCITFANFSGKNRPTDIIVKSRYKKIWAFTSEWEQLWEWPPGGKHLSDIMSTCHHPEPFDVDGDGKDELLASCIMLDHDGSELWHIDSDNMSIRGHLDCMRIAREGKRPEDFLLAISYCGANCLGLVDGTGEVAWERLGHHFESIDIGTLSSTGEVGIYVDIDHLPRGKSVGHLYNLDGDLLGKYHFFYGRHHRMLDWTGNGISEIVLGNAATIVDVEGNQVAILDLEKKAKHIQSGKKKGDAEPFVSIHDFTNNGRADIALHTSDKVYIYKNPSPSLGGRAEFIDDVNFTFY